MFLYLTLKWNVESLDSKSILKIMKMWVECIVKCRDNTKGRFTQRPRAVTMKI